MFVLVKGLFDLVLVMKYIDFLLSVICEIVVLVIYIIMEVELLFFILVVIK